MKKLLLAAAISSVALFASAEDVNYWVWTGGYTPATTDVVIPTSWDGWWACDFGGEVADATVLGGKCLSFTGQPGGFGAFSYGIANKWGDFSFTNDALRDLNLYFYAKCAGPDTENTMVKLTANTNEDPSTELKGQEIAYSLPKDGEWHLITMNVKNDFPDIYAAWETPGKGYVFSVSCNGVDGKESESTVFIGPIWYAAKNTVSPVPCQGVEFLQTGASINEGDGVQLEVEFTPADTTDPVYYTSNNEAVATVDAKGYVEGIAEGEAIITVTCGDFHDTCTITVLPGGPIDNKNYWVWTGGFTPESTDVVIPTSFDHWWACDFNGDVADETVLGGKCMSFTGQPGGYGAFSYGIANQWGDFSFTNDALRKFNLYFYAKCSGPETEETYVKLTAHTNEEGASEFAGEEVAYNLPKDGEWHIITMNIKKDFPAIYAAWETPCKGYVFSCSNKGVDGKESESTVFIGPIWYAAKNTIEVVPCEGVEFLQTGATIIKGDGVQLEVEIIPSNTTDPVYYESSNPAVATVDVKGYVEGIAEGEATITVTCGNFSDTCKITVEKDSGIDSISADAENGEEVFFNLQGVRVNNPENGIFIRVAGGKAVKVVK